MLGPGSGRYVVRPRLGEGPEQILVIRVAAEPPSVGRGRAGRRGRRARPATAEPAPVGAPVTVATVIEAAPVEGDRAASAWLDRATGVDAEATVAAALAVLQTALHGHRIATADPYVTEVRPGGALVTRVGWGTGEQVAEGRWASARELAPPDGRARSRREAPLRPQERLAALLGGRDATLACEELALRGRLDLDRGRDREAALQTHLALEAARIELAAWSGVAGMPDRLADLDGRREAVAQAANAALQGGLAVEVRSEVAEALGRVEAALRARSAAGSY